MPQTWREYTQQVRGRFIHSFIRSFKGDKGTWRAELRQQHNCHMHPVRLACKARQQAAVCDELGARAYCMCKSRIYIRTTKATVCQKIMIRAFSKGEVKENIWNHPLLICTLGWSRIFSEGHHSSALSNQIQHSQSFHQCVIWRSSDWQTTLKSHATLQRNWAILAVG